MEDIFIKRDTVISSFITPWILGLGCKTPEQAKKYIKYGETLCPYYYPINKEDINDNGHQHVYSRFINKLFDENNIDNFLTETIGQNVYKPWDCLSGIYQIKINDKMGLVARPNGVTENNECIIMIDDYITILNEKKKEEIKIKLLSTMAVWKAKKGVYLILNINEKIELNFDSIKWEEILNKIKLWAENI